MSEKKLKSHRIQRKIGFYFSIISILVLTISIFTYFEITSSNIRDNVRKRLKDIVGVASLQIDADAHSTLTNPEQENNETYLRIKKSLQDICKVSSDIHFIYTFF